MTLLVYHRSRGKSANIPPNTLSGIRWCLANGAQAIEYDVFYCREGSGGKVVMVEPKLLGEAGFDPDNLTWDQVRTIAVNQDTSAPEYPAELQDVLALVPSEVAQQVHLKTTDDRMVDAVLPLVRGAQNVVVTSFDLRPLRRIKDLSPTTPTGWLVKPDGKSAPERLSDLTRQSGEVRHEPFTEADRHAIAALAKEACADFVMLCAPKIGSPAGLDYFRAEGFQVGAWGVGDNFDLAARMIAFKIDRFTFDKAELLRT